ncbi:hypothetical protein LWI29_023419 [Acer saccharum]|uniref:DYW domain-containing protein n=1 Tax=Acer saccharum TaxID=4024 RepID=A0AA39W0B1_ACESA|nr:hypothetical protein LWI29_023419 [Acer saccharum]
MQFMETLSTPLVSLPTLKSDNQNRLVLSLIDRCIILKQLKQVHAHMLRTGLFFDAYSASKLFTASTMSPFSSLEYARKVFDEIPEPNLYTWNTLIHAYSWSPEPAATKLSSLGVGQVFHGLVVKSSFGDDVFILNSLIHFYASCGDLDFAYRAFVWIGEKDVVSWNSMISGFVQGGCFDKALELFREMEAENVKPNAVTMNGIKMDLTLSNAMLDMYVKCGSVEDAKKMFDKMEEKDIVSWTTMIDGKPQEALAIFRQLQLSKNANPDELTFVSTLSSCAQLGAMDVGEWIHENIKKQRMKLNCHLTTSLIDMYSKCGNLEKALDVFHSVERRDVFVWSSMIAGLAMHGLGRAAIDLFYRMHEAKVKPNAVTFTNVLCACSHSGLVEDGRMFFNQMEPVYGVVPGVKHYACMVDILGRAGLLEEAVEFVEKMPITPSASVWGALLGACKIHENVELAEQACSRLLELEPENDGALVLLSNIYAKRGKWDNVSELRKRMRVFGLQKDRGWSSMEVNGTLHKFLAADNSHLLSKEIYSKLDEIVAKLKSSGHVTNKSLLLQLVDEEDMKEQALNLHSEKLAIAFGLISTSPSQPIQIVKNLRVCGDCHTVAKLISQLYNREILLRDRLKGSNISSLGISQNSRRLSVQRNVKRTKDDLLGKHSEEVAFSEIEGDATNVNICRVFVLGVPRRFFGDWPFSTGGIGHIPPAATQQECKPG